MFYRAATTDQTPNNQALKGFYISEQMSSYISGNSVTGARMWHNYHSIFSPCPWIQRSRWHGWRLCKHPTTGAHIHYVHHLHTYLPPPISILSATPISTDPKLSPINVLSFRDQYQQPHGSTLFPYHFLLEELWCIIPGISCNLCRVYPSLPF